MLPYYLDLPTSFKLSKEQVAKLVAIGPKLLQAAPPYQCLLKVLATEAEGQSSPETCAAGAGIFPYWGEIMVGFLMTASAWVGVTPAGSYSGQRTADETERKSKSAY